MTRQVLPVNGALLNQFPAERQCQCQVGLGLNGDPLIGEGPRTSEPRIDMHHLQPVLLSGRGELLGPGQPAGLVAAGPSNVPAPGQEIPAVAEVGMQRPVQPDGVLTSPIRGITAVAPVMEFGRPGRLDEGLVVETPALAPSCLPEQQPLVPLPDLFDLFSYELQGVAPRDLHPLARDPFLVGPDQGRLHPIGIVHGHDLGLPLRAEPPLVSGVQRMALELDHPPVDLAGQHAAVLLPDPAGRGHPLLNRRR